MSRPRKSGWITGLALVSGLALRGEAAPVKDIPTVELPIDSVTVFSDRARVTRKAEVTRWSDRIRLPLLPTTTDPSSIRLEAQGVTVKGIEVRQAEKDEFPRSEAKALLDEIERLQKEFRAASEAIEPWQRERQQLLAVRPGSTPMPDPKGQPVMLDPTGWNAAADFFDARERAYIDAVGPLEARVRKLQKDLEVAMDRARQIAAAHASREGFVVDAVVSGDAKTAVLSLTYTTFGARWYPAYDVRWATGATQVDLDLSAFVAQETGEEWADASLVLSTAIPAAVPTLPELMTWKLGRKERFIPTPEQGWQPPQNPPPMPQPIPIDVDDTDQRLRERLLLALNEEIQVARRPSKPRPATSMEMARRKSTAAPPPPPSAPVPVAMAPMPSMAPRPAYEAEEDSEGAVDDMPRAAAVETMAARAPGGFFGGAQRATPTQSIPFGAPLSWRMPSFAADLPAALSGGFTFTYASARRETIPSGTGARKVALTSVRLPADPVVRIYPALRKDAFVTAEMKNTRTVPLLQGRAKIYVGGDLQGDATLPTVAAGQTVTLALGIDDAIKVERNVKVLDGEQGFFGSQEVSVYLVTIELANPRDRVVKARVLDQLPLPADKQKNEVKLVSSDPVAVPDDADGTLSWTLELAPGAKKVVQYRYSFARPKNWLPFQSSAPMGRQP